MASYNATAMTSIYNLSTVHSPSTNSSGGSWTTQSSMNLIAFRVLVIIIAVIGAVANGLVALVIGLSKQLKKDKYNVLFLNQMALDMYSCTMLTVVQVVKMVNLQLYGSWGYWLCMIILDEMLLWIGLNGSTANLVVIAIERYIKIVHPIWHKNHFRPQMIYAAVAFTWIDGIALNVPLLAATTGVANGRCMSYAYWSSDQAAYIYGIWYFVFFESIVIHPYL
jgi:7 transmembrane receptor (rhodopsin family)